MEKRESQGRIDRACAWLVSFGKGLVLVHSLTQAIPWLGGIVVSVVAATFGLVKPSDVALAFAAGIGAISTLVLGINFLVWFLEKRKRGWRDHAKKSEEQIKQRDEDLAETKALLRVEREKTERLQIATNAMHGLSLDPLVIRNPLRANDLTKDWIAARFLPALSRLAPGVGLGLVAWRDGTYRLVCDHGVPDIVRVVLPKRTSNHLSICIDRLGLGKSAVVPLSEGMMNPEGQEWLVAFPERNSLDDPAESVFAVGARIIADARSGGDGRTLASLPV